MKYFWFNELVIYVKLCVEINLIDFYEVRELYFELYLV
jgi:hypothetical protein